VIIDNKKVKEGVKRGGQSLKMRWILILLTVARLSGASRVYANINRTKTSSSVEKTNRKSQELTESREERALEETREGRGISDLPERREGPNTSEVREGRGLWDNLPSNQHSTAYQRHADPERTTKKTFWGQIGPNDLHVYSERPSTTTSTEKYNQRGAATYASNQQSGTGVDRNLEQVVNFLQRTGTNTANRRNLNIRHSSDIDQRTNSWTLHDDYDDYSDTISNNRRMDNSDWPSSGANRKMDSSDWSDSSLNRRKNTGAWSNNGVNRRTGLSKTGVNNRRIETSYLSDSNGNRRMDTGDWSSGGELVETAESRFDQVMRVNRLAANTMQSLQGNSPRRKSSGSGRRSSGSGRRHPVVKRRMGTLSDQEELLVDTQETENLFIEGGSSSGTGSLEKQVNAVRIMEMIKNLQEEIQDIDAEIEAENDKMRVLDKEKEEEVELSLPQTLAAKESAEETMKELSLEKEDTTMKKIIAQMMLMKQIQKKKEESDKLETALQKLAKRRKLINSALRKQKEVASEKRRLAQLEIERQKEIMEEKQRVIQSIIQRNEEEKERRVEKEKDEKRKLNLQVKSQNLKKEKIVEQTGLLAAHMKLVDRSNERILARIEELKLERQKEMIAEQERVLSEQQAAISALRELKKTRRQKQKQRQRLRDNQKNTVKAEVSLSAQLKKQPNALLSLSSGERKKVMEWLDLERNAAILQKTDQKIAEKLRLKAAAETIGGNGELSPALKIKNAAQILLAEDDDLTDAEIDNILGLGGVDSGLSVSDILGIDDQTLLEQLDDDELLFDDYDEYEDDYQEIFYDYEYEDEEPAVVTGVVDEYQYEYYDDDEEVVADEYVYEYEYEEVVRPPPRPKPYKPRPSYPRYPAKRPTSYKPRPAYHERPAYNERPSYHSYAATPKPYAAYKPAYRQPYAPPYENRRPTSGAQFLSDVSGLLGEAEHSVARGVEPHITLTGSLREALLRDVNDEVVTEIRRLPGGRVSTKVSIGHHPQNRMDSSPTHSRVEPPETVRGSKPPRIDPRTPRRPSTSRRRQSERPRSSSPKTFSDLMTGMKSSAEEPGLVDASYSHIMGDLLKGRPLPPGVKG